MAISMFSPVLKLVSRFGVDPTDDRETRNRKDILIIASICGSLCLVLWSLPMFALGVPLAGALWLLYALVMSASLAFWVATHRGYRTVVFVHTACLLLFPFMLSLLVGSFTRIGLAWFALVAVLAALFYFPR